MAASFSSLAILLIAAVFVVIPAIAILLFKRGAGAPGQPLDVPSCGNCGYPTRGITELNCPECGADLRKVGIVRPGEGRFPLAGCLLPLLFTIALPLAAVLCFGLLAQVMPTHRQQSATIYLAPDSGQYDEVQVRVQATLIIPAGTSSTGTGLSTSSSFGPPYVTTATLNGFGPKSKMQAISLKANPTPQTIAAGNWAFASFFEIDPVTGQATWTDRQGKTQTSAGPVTDRDVLAYLGEAGADVTSQQVIDESKYLAKMIDGLIKGGNTLTVSGFRAAGSGSGSSEQVGPPWFLPVYAGAWVLIWIVGLVVIIRWGRKNAKA